MCARCNVTFSFLFPAFSLPFSHDNGYCQSDDIFSGNRTAVKNKKGIFISLKTQKIDESFVVTNKIYLFFFLLSFDLPRQCYEIHTICGRGNAFALWTFKSYQFFLYFFSLPLFISICDKLSSDWFFLWPYQCFC